jgi:hypothetical protein
MPDIDDDSEPLFSKLTDEELMQCVVNNHDFKALTTSYISEEVRRECIAEMEAAKARGWKRH